MAAPIISLLFESPQERDRALTQTQQDTATVELYAIIASVLVIGGALNLFRSLLFPVGVFALSAGERRESIRNGIRVFVGAVLAALVAAVILQLVHVG